MNSRSFLVAVVVMAGALSGSARAAAPPQFDATVTSDSITLDDTIKLVVTLSRDATQAYQGYMRPELKDFDILNQAETESTQWTVTNAVQTTRTIEQHIYILKPKHKGPCTIPAATARIDGREWKTRDIMVKVSPAAKKPPGDSGQPEANASPGIGLVDPDGMRGDEDLFIEARADRTTAYIGEQVVVSWYIYSRGDVLRYRAIAEPKHDDFWSEEMGPNGGKLPSERKLVKGQEYQASLLLRRALFPLKSGRLTITPLEIEATTQQTLFYALGSKVRASKPVVIDALPLPAQGRPEGFETQNVGRFELSAVVDKTKVDAGDAITYRALLKVQGNARNVKLPRLDKLDGFKVYEPTVTESIERTDRIQGYKTFRWVLLPRKGGDLVIPPLTLWYFDPETKKYEKTETAPMAITVVGNPEKIGAGAETKENVLGPRIRGLRNTHHVESHLGEKVLRGPVLWIALAVPPALLLITMFGGAVRATLRRETAGTRRRRARAAARRRLRNCEIHIKGQRPSQFFAECARVLYEHLEYRLGMKFEAFTMDHLRRVLVERGIDEKLADSIASELESCDFARFAPSASGPGEMKAAIRRVRELLDGIEGARVSDGRPRGQEAAA